MKISRQGGFEGWYFKHQKEDDMIAFIPGQAESGAFIQLISQEGARQFEVSQMPVREDGIQADRCRFSKQGCHIELPGIQGEITYGPFAPPPFRHHGAISFFSYGVPARCTQHGP